MAEAFGHPGIPPRWTHGAKDGVGTAYSADSKVWFTLWNGCVTEVYYPTIDRPQIRDLQFLVSDGETFFHDEKRHMRSEIERISPRELGYRITNHDPDGRYTITKEVVTAPHMPCLLVHTRLEGDPGLKLYALCAPHVEGGGWGNNAQVIEAAGRTILACEKDGRWLALAANVPFARTSCGFVGASDGWTDLSRHFGMTWEFDRATDGNVALTGEIDAREFTLALAFGDGQHAAVTTLLQSLGIPYADHRKRFLRQWQRAYEGLRPLEAASGDGGRLYRGSYGLLLGHEDKTYAGAFIASLSIPWGQVKGDEDGGYHLVWTRDMVNTAGSLLAAGDTTTPLRALIYLAASQEEDGGFPQNFWLNGDPHWSAIQLDEVAQPILLAWRMRECGCLADFDPLPMVLRGAGYLIRHGPATQQERWEEASGYSPSTLATNIAALICAADFARTAGLDDTARYLEEYADFLECHVEAWTVTTEGTLLPDVPRHFIRIHPVGVNDFTPDEDPNRGTLEIANRGPRQRHFPAKEIVDAGFLELVRYGVRRAGDPLFEDSLRVVDAVLKVETPVGPCWRRYNHDGYGERPDGGPYEGWGRGRAWPLLTGERGHYELAAGRDADLHLRALEGFVSTGDLLPEQVWDDESRPDLHMMLGRPTGSAMPLLWSHAEYIKLLRSRTDGAVFDRIPAVADRYQAATRTCPRLEIWKPNRRPQAVSRGFTLRVQAPKPFRLRWTRDEWATLEDTPSTPTGLGIEYVDLVAAPGQNAPFRFTFFWTGAARWEGRDHAVSIG